ncbi:hypothetical protein ACEPAI_2671 [Sanghuangporus weigelae]
MNGSKRGPPTAPPKHMNDFTKALAAEVRILLQEVGQLRDERRQLQFEIAELMAVKSKHGAGGEYTPDWMPKQPMPPGLPEVAAPPPIEDAAREPAPPAWRTIVKHEPRRKKPKTPQPQAITAGATPVVAPAPQLPSWAQWKPNNNVIPQPRAGAVPSPQSPLAAPPPRDEGLFGPSTPPPK